MSMGKRFCYQAQSARMAFEPVSARGLKLIVSNVCVRTPLRHPPHRQHILFQRQRLFRTLLPIRQLEHRLSVAVDDVTIPFDRGSKQELSREKPINDESLHAEIELVPGPVQQSYDSVDARATSSTVQTNPSENCHNVSKGDPGRPHEPHITLENDNKNQNIAVDLTRVREEARAVARLKRKIRRIESGKYKPGNVTGISEEQSDHPVTQLSAVLQKIESMPAIDSNSAEENTTDGILKTIRTKNKSKQREADHTSPRKKEPPASPNQAQKPGGSQAKARTQLSESSASKPKKEAWQIQKAALERKFGAESWRPRKRLSPDTLEGIRALHASDPELYTTEIIAQHFKVSPEAIRRVLKSKWRPNDDEIEDRRKRWEKRGVKKWQEMADEGMRPPAKWRALGVKSAEKTPEGRPMWLKKRSGATNREESGSVKRLAVRSDKGVD